VAWQQLILHLRAEELPQAEALLELAGALALSIGDAADHPLIEPAPGETPLWPSVEVRALFTADRDLGRLGKVLRETLRTERIPAIEALADARWTDAWREHITVRELGGGFAVIPADTPAASAPPRHLKLHMGLAFGTGQHATTALCLEWLAAQRLAGLTVLDFGCGSGILALAALKLGAARAYACDNDPQALTATGDNASLNGLHRALWVGEPQSLPPLQTDVILANIVAGTLTALAERFAACAARGAAIVLSGILAEQRNDVESAYAAYFEDFCHTQRDGWTCVVGRRSHRPFSRVC
jgi:ribosomal protein L11 methyltransferase